MFSDEILEDGIRIDYLNDYTKVSEERSDII